MRQFRSVTLLLLGFSITSPALGLVQSLSRFSNTLTQLSNSLQRRPTQQMHTAINNPHQQNNPQDLSDQEKYQNVLKTQQKLQQEQEGLKWQQQQQQNQQQAAQQREKFDRRGAEQRQNIARQQHYQERSKTETSNPTQQDSLTIYGIAYKIDSGEKSCSLNPIKEKIALISIKDIKNKQTIIDDLIIRLRNFKPTNESYFVSEFNKTNENNNNCIGIPTNWRNWKSPLAWVEETNDTDLLKNLINDDQIVNITNQQVIATKSSSCAKKLHNIAAYFQELYADNTLIWHSEKFVPGAEEIEIIGSIAQLRFYNQKNSAEEKEVYLGPILNLVINATKPKDIEDTKKALNSILQKNPIFLSYKPEADAAFEGNTIQIYVGENKTKLKKDVEELKKKIINSIGNQNLISIEYVYAPLYPLRIENINASPQNKILEANAINTNNAAIEPQQIFFKIK